MTTLICKFCGKKFTMIRSYSQHILDAHAKKRTKKTLAKQLGKTGAKELLFEIGDDLPDGAFFALAHDLGLEPEDLIDDEVEER